MQHRLGASRAILMFLLACSGVLATGCGSDQDKRASSSGSVASDEPSSVATLREGVRLIGNTRAEWVASGTDSEWILRQPLDAPVGTVLLLADVAVKVEQIRTVDGQTQLSVIPAELEEVFAKVSLHEMLDLDHATFEPLSEDAKLRAARSQDKVIGGTLNASKRLAIALSEGPFSGELSFGLRGRLRFDWDDSGAAGAQGRLEVVGDVTSVLRAMTSKAKTYALPERRIGTLRIPIPISIVDKVLTVVGVRTAAIDIPVSLGAELMTGFDMSLKVEGRAQTGAVVSYTRDDGLTVDGPNDSATFTVSGELPSMGPRPFASASVRVGPYVHARPQLLILNKVASIGADLKVGLYAHGTASLLTEEPYYCLSLQPELTAGVFGFFKAVGVSERTSKPKEARIPVGSAYQRGRCSDAGDEADAASDAGDSEAIEEAGPSDSAPDADAAADLDPAEDASSSGEGTNVEGIDAGLPPTAGNDAGSDAGGIKDAGETQAQRCEAACAYRTDTLGCGGDPNTCAALCLAFRNVASQQGKCSALALDLEECRYSREALGLGCTVSDSVIDMRLCTAQSAALAACKKQRDCPAGAVCR